MSFLKTLILSKTVVQVMNNSEKLVGFEGAEKILHIKITSPPEGNGLLSIPQDSWSSILTAAKCTILSKISTQYDYIFLIFIY